MPVFEPQTIVLATLVASLVLFVTDALRYEIVAVLVVIVLAGTGCLDEREAFANFASPAVVLVASMYVFAAAASRTGVTEVLCNRMIRGGDSSEARITFQVTATAGVLSSFLSNAAVVATLIPVLGSLSRSTRVPISRLLMPLAFGSLLGGMVTVIATSKNIAVNGVLEQSGVEPFHLFEFTHLGLCLLAVGCLYFLGPGRALLPKGRVDRSLTEHYQVPKFVTEALVEPASTLINRSVSEIPLLEQHGVSVLGIVRAGGEGEILAPGPYNRIRRGDLLILQGEPEAILRVRGELDLKERSDAPVGDTRLASGDVLLLEVVVPATSALAGRTLAEADFRASTGLNVLAISKHGDVRPSKLKETRLEVGDALLVQGHRRDLLRLRESRELIVLGEVEARGFGRSAWLTIGLLGAVLLLAAVTEAALPLLALGGAVGLVLLGCIRPDDVRRGVDWSVLVLIGGMLALGQAFRKHELGDALAEELIGLAGDVASPFAAIAILLVVTTLLTQVMNYAAAAVIMTPVALSLVEEFSRLGIDVNQRGFLMAVMTGASLSFMSPVSHQANAMVVGPGDYRYSDFLRAGTPLTIVLLAVSLLLLPIFWPNGG